jgi:DNA-binding response OmpR family regulator
MKILLVEDEEKLNTKIKKILETKAYAVDSAFDGEEGERLAKWNDYDLILLDLMLPKRDGMEVCKNLRAAGKTTPILMLTARDAVEDKVTGLDSGADDYLAKPFSFEELLARMRSLLRRPSVLSTDVFEWDGLTLDTRSQQVMVGGKQLMLTLREYGLLEYLIRNKGAVLTRDDLLEHVWDMNHDTLSNVVDVHMKNLRNKLPKIHAKNIQTIRGKGYRLV